MASITTILGTDSVSSSRIVINNNFDALNTELGSIATVLDTSSGTLTLANEIKGGTLKIFNGSINTLEVTASDITARVETTFDEKVTFEKAIVTSASAVATTFPTPMTASSYVLDASTFSSAITLPAADNGQEVTIIADGVAGITLDNSNITAVTAPITITDGGAVTLKYYAATTSFYVVSAMNSTVTY